MNIQVRFGHQPLELAVLDLQFPQPFGLADVPSAIFGALLVKADVVEAVFAADLLDRHTGFGLPQKANNLFFAEFACSCVHHFLGSRTPRKDKWHGLWGGGRSDAKYIKPS